MIQTTSENTTREKLKNERYEQKLNMKKCQFGQNLGKHPAATTGLSFLFSLFLKTQHKHWTKLMLNIRLTT